MEHVEDLVPWDGGVVLEWDELVLVVVVVGVDAGSHE